FVSPGVPGARPSMESAARSSMCRSSPFGVIARAAESTAAPEVRAPDAPDVHAAAAQQSSAASRRTWGIVWSDTGREERGSREPRLVARAGGRGYHDETDSGM